MKLSILIPSLPSRAKKLSDLLETLTPQLSGEVELLILTDNKKSTLGKKRNDLISIAQWQYVVFIDDDDGISQDYVSSLLSAIKTNPDVVCFNVEITINGKDPREVIYSKDLQDSFDWVKYYRAPNHLMCFRKDIATKEKYSDINYWEDSDYSKRIQKHIVTEVQIQKTLYFYRSVPNESECKT